MGLSFAKYGRAPFFINKCDSSELDVACYNTLDANPVSHVS